VRLSVYIPKEIEGKLEEAAQESGMSITKLIQEMVREKLGSRQRSFSRRFLALAGSWEDDRNREEILRDLRAARVGTQRATLR
jgi:hypothetical protein